MPATTFLAADFFISSKKSLFEFTRQFRYMTFGSLELIWKLETLIGKSCT